MGRLSEGGHDGDGERASQEYGGAGDLAVPGGVTEGVRLLFHSLHSFVRRAAHFLLLGSLHSMISENAPGVAIA
ncbi:MAG: hypothetical protein M3066_15670, partial [Actinomycetota bacterium]|nr:hypothetical protein [Actinomycetota bacterium]